MSSRGRELLARLPDVCQSDPAAASMSMRQVFASLSGSIPVGFARGLPLEAALERVRAVSERRRFAGPRAVAMVGSVETISALSVAANA